MSEVGDQRSADAGRKSDRRQAFPVADLLLLPDRAAQIGNGFLVRPAAFLRLAQSAGRTFGSAVTSLGEFGFQLIDFFHAAFQFRTERGDFFLGETVEGHFPDAVRDDLGRCHFVEQRLRDAKITQSGHCSSGKFAQRFRIIFCCLLNSDST